MSDQPAYDLGDVVAANVRGERGRQRWTQDRLARELGWSRQTVTDLEAGRRRVMVADLPQLCRAFGVGMDRFLIGADERDLEVLRLRF